MFDPLAFTKPEKAFTFEGLVSHDMFEHFAAEDEAAYNYIASGAALDAELDEPFDDVQEDTEVFDTPEAVDEPEVFDVPEVEASEILDYLGYPTRLHFLASLLQNHLVAITESLNIGYTVAINITPTLCSLLRLDSSYNQYDLHGIMLDGGPPLSIDEIWLLASLIERNMKTWLSGPFLTTITNNAGNDGQVNVFLMPLTFTFSTDAPPGDS